MRISDWSSDVALPIYRSPGCSALNSPEPEGCQKLASSGAIPSRKLNQGLCVTPTNILITNITMTVWVPLAMSAFHNTGRVPAKQARGMPQHLLLTTDRRYAVHTRTAHFRMFVLLYPNLHIMLDILCVDRKSDG